MRCRRIQLQDWTTSEGIVDVPGPRPRGQTNSWVISTDLLRDHCSKRLKERPKSEDHRRTNSWVRPFSVASKTSEIRFTFSGRSKSRRMIWVPGRAPTVALAQ